MNGALSTEDATDQLADCLRLSSRAWQLLRLQSTIHGLCQGFINLMMDDHDVIT